MSDLIYYVLFTSITHALVNIVELGYFRLTVFVQRTYLTIKRRWSPLKANRESVLEMRSMLPASFSPSEEISTEYCESLLMLSWSIMFSSALPIVSVLLTVVFLARCRLLLHHMLVLRSSMLPHYLNTYLHWLLVLKFVIATAVFSNATILAFVSKNAEYRGKNLAFTDDLQASSSQNRRRPITMFFECR